MTSVGQSVAYFLRGGQVLDGTGAPARRADISIAGGRIEDIGADLPRRGEEIDVSGLTLAPGFIDLHTHIDFTLPRFPRADAMVRQGVTTMLVGNCGHSTFPVGAGERADLLRRYSSFLSDDLDWSWRDGSGYRAALNRLPLAVNVALQVGHGTVRIAAMGFDARQPTDSELDEMRRHVADAMDAGAFGISTGLIYPPGTYASTDEVVALAEIAGRYGGFYSTHMRDEGAGLLTSVGEAIEVARRGGLPLEISHHKAIGRRNWGLTASSLALIDEARRDGLDVSMDQYPYQASATTLTALVPTWALEGGTDALRKRLGDPAIRAQLRSEVIAEPGAPAPKRDFEPDTVMIASLAGPDGPIDDSSLVGHTLDEIAAQRRVAPVDVLLDLLAEHGGGVEVVIFAIGEEDIRRVMTHPHVAIASDGWTLHPDAGGCPHPRSYGTFARVLGHYVREEGVLDLAEAVRKMTSLPARRLGIADRGTLRVGSIADVVAFDPVRVAERATFTAPHQFCAGVEHVLVNGEQVIEHGKDTGAAAGLVLSREGGR